MGLPCGTAVLIGTYVIDHDPPITHTMLYLGTEKPSGEDHNRTERRPDAAGSTTAKSEMDSACSTSRCRARPSPATKRTTFIGYASPACATESDRASDKGSGLAFSVSNLTLSIPMLHYAVIFLVIAIIAAVLGFTGIAGTAAWIAKVLFVVFLVLFLISLVRGRKPRI